MVPFRPWDSCGDRRRAAEEHKLLGQGDGQATAGVWAAVAQLIFCYLPACVALAFGREPARLTSRPARQCVVTRCSTYARSFGPNHSGDPAEAFSTSLAGRAVAVRETWTRGSLRPT